VPGLVRALRALERAYSPGGHGRWSARRRAGLVDQAVRDLSVGFPPSVAVVALGGYGRELLTPGSDVDLMVLHRERRPGRIRETAERLFYPFWDAGISLGHAVRTVDQCVAGARERVDTACSLLDARLVWGDATLATAMEERVLRVLRKDPDAFLRRLDEDAASRAARFPACTTNLEPDLKEGAGGVRDVHVVGWAAAVVGRAEASGPDLLTGREARALEDAEEFLVRLRSALHLETGRRGDVLHLDHQPALAEAFGFTETAGLDAADALMRTLFEHAREVDHARASVLDRARRRGTGPARVALIEAPRTLEAAIELFAEAAEAGGTPSPASLDAIERADLGPTPLEWSPGLLRGLLRILRMGGRGSAAFEAMDRTGLLGGLLPAWEAVRCRPQRDPYHRFTVDVHLARAAAAAADLLERPGPDPIAGRAVEAVRDRDALLLGALLHDIGKTGEGRHVEVGVSVAAETLERMAVPGDTRDAVLFLVREHLLLSDTATRRDLSDQNLVLDVAARVGSPERLALLYLLTVADASATGPHAWTPWRQALIRELVAKVEHVLARGEMGTDVAVDLEDRLRAIRELLGAEEPRRVEVFLERMPRPYLLTVPPDAVARHFPVLAPALGATEVRTVAWPGDRPGTHELTVVARDRPGLLARMAGSLALTGLNILAARAFTSEDGVAVDLFAVEPAFEADVDEEWWRRLRSTLRKAIEGRLSLDYRVREKRGHYPPPRVSIPVKVKVDNRASDFFTVVEVSAPDRIGLLFDLARTFQDLELDVHLAKVATMGGRVVDAFYVRDLYGRKVEEEEHAREIERAITARLAQP
jgi:[protein-PII] uridylyltransferase